jgi:arginase family enzyme
MATPWPRRPSQPVTEMMLPRFYGSTPTVFGSPRAKTPADLAGADFAFLGVPWSAPAPDSRSGAAAANFFGTNLTPGLFRTNSLKYGGYLPELDVDVFERYRVVDYGDSDVVHDLQQTFDNATMRVTEIIEAGARPITMGGNSGPSSYAVIKAIAAKAGGPTAVLNMDAHHDNLRGEARDDSPEQPRWGGTWARRILDLPGVDPQRYFHFGLRGPRNDREVFDRFLEKGADRSHIYTFRDLMRARRSGFEEWSESVAQQLADGATKVWIAIDADVLDLSASPEWGDEPLGPRADEVCWLCYEVGRAVGLERFGGISFMAIPHEAMTTQWMCIYILLYALAGTVHAATGERA